MINFHWRVINYIKYSSKKREKESGHCVRWCNHLQSHIILILVWTALFCPEYKEEMIDLISYNITGGWTSYWALYCAEREECFAHTPPEHETDPFMNPEWIWNISSRVLIILRLSDRKKPDKDSICRGGQYSVKPAVCMCSRSCRRQSYDSRWRQGRSNVEGVRHSEGAARR